MNPLRQTQESKIEISVKASDLLSITVRKLLKWKRGLQVLCKKDNLKNTAILRACRTRHIGLSISHLSLRDFSEFTKTEQDTSWLTFTELEKIKLLSGMSD